MSQTASSLLGRKMRRSLQASSSAGTTFAVLSVKRYGVVITLVL